LEFLRESLAIDVGQIPQPFEKLGFLHRFALDCVPWWMTVEAEQFKNLAAALPT
jgi:hypothetical protein